MNHQKEGVQIKQQAKKNCVQHQKHYDKSTSIQKLNVLLLLIIGINNPLAK